MSRESFVRVWLGPVLSLLGAAAILWLAYTGRLGWYIHPRYVAFTLVMCSLAVIVLIAAAPVLRGARCAQAEAATSDAGDAAEAARALDNAHGRNRERASLAMSALLVIGTAVALLIVPPATLSSDLAQQRQIGAGTLGGGEPDAALPADAGDATVKDWAMQLRQNGGAALERQQAAMLGFVLPDPYGADDTFLIARFSISCCAVDAQPLGVPVHLPDWQQQFTEGQWVDAEGVFVVNPDARSPHQTVLLATAVSPAEEPADPYVY